MVEEKGVERKGELKERTAEAAGCGFCEKADLVATRKGSPNVREVIKRGHEVKGR